MFTYDAFGLTVRSELELPELPAVGATGACDVTIRQHALPSVPDAPSGTGVQVGVSAEGPAREVRLTWPEIGRYHIRDARQIIVSPNPGVPPTTIRLPLLGVVMGVLLHVRGCYTLHASAVAVEGAAAAFVGWKGAGKSTMAAEMQRRGHPLITDDVLAVDPATLQVPSAFPQIKLHPEAVAALGSSPASLARIHPDINKYALRSTLHFSAAAHPLRAVFVLAVGDRIRCDVLTGREAFLALLSQSFAPRFLGSTGHSPEDLQHGAALARTVPVVRLERPRDLSRLSDVAGCVESFLREKLPVGPPDVPALLETRDKVFTN